ncbi:MAG: hypothetical protein K0U41_06900 [Gammaproteobacteria bacterium]|nr:hypothetical protein [Gammaproteobacteria bacterium]
MSKNLFGNLLKNENFFQASTIVEEMAIRVPERTPFYSTSPTMSWGSAAGFQSGTIELMYGPKSSGKTMIVLDRIKMNQQLRDDTIQVFVDAEMSMEFESTIRWMRANGVDTDRVLIIREVDIKKIFEKHILKDLQLELKEGNVKVDYIAFDSVQAMSTISLPTTEKQIKKLSDNDGYTKQDYGARANYLSRIFAPLRMFCRDYRIFVTFIGQARSGGADRFGNTIWVTNGGEALYHEVQYRTLVTPAGEPVFDETTRDANGNAIQVGHRIKFTFEKNKMAEGHNRKGFCDIAYMKGIINTESELAELAPKLGLVETKGAWFYYEDKKFNGKKQFSDFLIEYPDEYDILFTKVMMAASTNPTTAVEFDKETGEIKE